MKRGYKGLLEITRAYFGNQVDRELKGVTRDYRGF